MKLSFKSNISFVSSYTKLLLTSFLKHLPSNIGIATSLYNTITVICDVKITYHKTIRHAAAKSIEKINHDAMP